MITDYPDGDLIENLKFNIDKCEYLKASGSEVAAEVWMTLVYSYIS